MHTELIQIALAEVGVREVGGNNRGDRIREYQRATWLDPAPWPWCAAFTAWILKQWLLTPLGRVYLGVNRGVEGFRCKDASAFGWEKWAASRGLEILPESQLARASDLVVFDFSHIGIVVADQLSLRDDIVTVEGNTSGSGETRDSQSDGVWKRFRNPSLVRSYIRLGTHAP